MTTRENILKLNQGIYLEKSNVLIPWGTHFNDLINYGKPEVRTFNSNRVDMIWEDESILGGTQVYIQITRYEGFLSTAIFSGLYAFVTFDNLMKAKDVLTKTIGNPKLVGKTTDNEFNYTWRFKDVVLKLRQRDRFGFYWTIETYQRSWLDKLIYKTTTVS